MITRRSFLRGALTGLAGAGTLPQLLAATGASPSAVKYRIGSCVVDFDQAKLAGLDGVEIRVGNPADKLQIADPSNRQRYKDQMSSTGLVISSFMMGLLNDAPLASDPRAPAWLEQSIDGAKDLKVGVILVAFFGKGDLLKDGQVHEAAVDTVVKRLKDAAPRAKDAGVILALENRLSARQNLAVPDRIGHDSVRVYYDVGNLTNMGSDVAAEIRFLKDRIACFHFKDGGGYLGDGKVPYDPIAASIKAIGYQGWIVMETPNPSKDAVADAKRNAAFIHRLFTRVASKPAARQDSNYLAAISDFGPA